MTLSRPVRPHGAASTPRPRRSVRPGAGTPLRATALSATLVASLACVTLLTLGSGWPGTSGVRPALAGEVVTRDGVPHVLNGAEPAAGRRDVALEELWRAGGDDDTIFFGNVVRVLEDEDRNVYVLDSQLSEIQVYAPDGTHLRTGQHEGEGPGEVRRPNDMFFLPGGNIALMQGFPGKVVVVDREGNPASGFDYGTGDPSQGRFAVLVQGVSRGGTIALCGIDMRFSGGGASEQTYFLAACDANGTETHRYLTKSYTIDYSAFTLDEGAMDFVYSRFDVGPDGSLYVAPERNRYAIQVMRPDGTLVRVIERDYTSQVRDDAERQEARLTVEAIGRNYPAPLQGITVEDTEPDLVGLRAMDDGSLWVQPTLGEDAMDDGVLTVLDVFDGEGHFREQLALRAPGDSDRDSIHILDTHRIVVVRGALDAFRSSQGVGGDAAGGEAAESVPLEIVCYALPEA
ncbi:MAG: hypothetical protein PVF43_01590 [Candidatus Eiseniibacteriota bacterium]|jgi:hypothetical protein